MSWKSLITAGLFCLLASPAFAAPTMNIVKGGTFANNYLDANGNWVWNVQITPDQSLVPDATGTPVAAELGFTSNRVVSAATQGSGFDTLNPGKSIFGFEVPGACNANGNPCGIAINPTGSLQVFSAIGSPNVTASTPMNYLTLTAAGPSTASSLASTITVSGAYGGKGRIAQITGGTSGGPYTTGNTDTFNGVFSHTAHAGDANLDGNVDGLDLAVIAANFGATSGKHWYQADYNTDTAVDGLDLAIIAANFGFVGPPPGAGAGGGGLSNGAVPEPASIALLGLAMLGGLGTIRRKR